MPAAIEPLTVDAAEVAGWAEGGSWQYRLARQWVRLMPRGKGWFPRLIGRRFGGGMRDTIRTARGAALAVAPASLDVYCAIAHTGGAWDPQVFDACARFLRPGDVFYDIGANVGFMSIEMAKRFDDAVSVFAFEPQRSLAKTVAVSAKLNGFQNVKVFSTMLGKEAGEADLYVPSHSIHASAVSREAGAAVEHCRVVTLDGLVNDGVLPPPRVIKIDVEGGEWDVFHGAEQTIREHRPFIAFESDANATRFGYTHEQLCGFLRETGRYAFYAIHAGRLEAVDPLSPGLDSDNFLATPAEMSL